MKRITTVQDALRRLEPDQQYWVDAYLSLMGADPPIIEARYRNPELAGVWVIRYKITRGTVSRLLRGNYLELDPKSSLDSELIYRPKKKQPR